MKRLQIVALAGALAGACLCLAKDEAPQDKRSVSELLKAFGDELPSERLRAAKALGAKGTDALPKVLAALKDKSWKVRRSATDAIAAMGPDANSAVPALAAALKDRDAWVRDGAAEALGKVGKDVKAAAEALAKAVTDKDAWVRESAMSALKSVTRDKDILLPAAVAAIKVRHSGWNVRRHAVSVLSQYGGDYEPAAAALLEMLEHPSEGMWDCTGGAVDVLIKMGKADRAVPILTRRLKSARRGSRRTAAAMLGKIGAAAEAATAALKAVAEGDSDKGIRKVAATALEQIAAAKAKQK